MGSDERACTDMQTARRGEARREARRPTADGRRPTAAKRYDNGGSASAGKQTQDDVEGGRQTCATACGLRPHWVFQRQVNG